MLRRSLLANFAGQTVAVALGIVMVPVYVRYLGVEAYGLVAFNAVLLAWVVVLDFGLSPTLCRELGSIRAGTGSVVEISLLLESIEKLIVFTGALLSVLSIVVAPYFAERWFKASSLPTHEIQTSFVLMMLTANIRWLSALYRGGIVGIDRQVMLNIIATTFAILRTVGVVPLIALRPRIEIFFIWQLIAIVGETIAMRMLLARTIGSSIFSTRFSWTVLRSRAKLSLSIAVSALFWASMTQIDKLILSKVLPLAQFSVFSLATLLAGGIMLVTNPIQQAFIPRLNAESFNGGEQLFQTYVLATEVTSVAVIPVATIFFFVPGAVFRLWSESVPATEDALLTLQFYAIGNACWAIASIQYFVQYAKGDLSLHLKGTLGFIALSIPALLYAGTRFGVVGVASVWLGLNAVFLFGWVAVVHRIFLAGINGYWYRGVLSRVAAVIPAGLIISRIDSTGYSRIGLLVFILGTWLVMVALTLVASPIVQRKARYLVMRMIPS